MAQRSRSQFDFVDAWDKKEDQYPIYVMKSGKDILFQNYFALDRYSARRLARFILKITATQAVSEKEK